MQSWVLQGPQVIIFVRKVLGWKEAGRLADTAKLGRGCGCEHVGNQAQNANWFKNQTDLKMERTGLGARAVAGPLGCIGQLGRSWAGTGNAKLGTNHAAGGNGSILCTMDQPVPALRHHRALRVRLSGKEGDKPAGPSVCSEWSRSSVSNWLAQSHAKLPGENIPPPAPASPAMLRAGWLWHHPLVLVVLGTQRWGGCHTRGCFSRLSAVTTALCAVLRQDGQTDRLPAPGDGGSLLREGAPGELCRPPSLQQHFHQ